MTVARLLDQVRTQVCTQVRAQVHAQVRAAGTRRLSAIGMAAATGAATLALGFAPGDEAAPAARSVPAPAPVKLSAQDTGASLQAGSLREQSASAYQQAQQDAIEAERRAAAEEMAQEKREARRQAEAERRAARERAEKQRAASRSAARERQQAAPSYPDNLDGWIREALAIMKREGIPGTYEGIHRNIMRESSGNPRAINTWDINARNGVPSKGLLQVIQPTFDAYHVEGTAYDLYDPVANIVAACNYAADRYGSIDNVNGPY